jgi:F-type H+-transporting ATPase subunit a
MNRTVLATFAAVWLAFPAETTEHRPTPEGEHPGLAEGAHHEKRSVSDAIFGHVSDEHELEFEAPFGEENVARVELPRTWKADLGGHTVDFSPTKHLVWLWITALLLVVGLALFRPKSITPKGFALALEMLVLFVRDEIAKPTIGEPEYKRYTPYLLSCFFFILVANLIGILPYTASATGNVAVTAGLAITTFLMTQAASIRAAGIGGYLKHLTGGVHPLLWPIMIPVEILGLFTKPFALCMRLFANMVAGHIVIFYLLGLIFILKTIYVAPISVALAACIYLLEIFVAFLQAYVFTMLSSLFIGMGVAMGHHGHEGHHHAESDPKVAP